MEEPIVIVEKNCKMHAGECDLFIEVDGQSIMVPGNHLKWFLNRLKEIDTNGIIEAYHDIHQ